jgi:type IV pilus assembly protein PilE
MHRRLRSTPSGARGFTLVEAMITVAVLSVLLAIAIPGYREMIRSAARADAQLVLQMAANHLERLYAECNSYTRRDAGTTPPCTTVIAGLPASMQHSPVEGRARYDIVLQTHQAQAYELRAVPVDATEPCGTLRLLSDGQRLVTGTRPAEACWRR